MIKTNWDYKTGIEFYKLIEFRALYNHINGIEKWSKSEFAYRYLHYLRKNNIKSDRKIKSIDNFLTKREKQIDKLIDSILKKGIYKKRNKKLFIDNISVALTKSNELLFNNRGHHRLSIAKILHLNKIPVKITITKSTKILEQFEKQYC